MAANSTVWILPVVIFALRFSGQGMMSHLAVVAMARWFVATRGRALAIVGLGFSVGEAMLPLLVVALMTVIEWRLIWVGAGLIAICGLPLLLKLLAQERTPQAMSKSGQAEGMEHRHWTRKQALRHWLFWFMVPALLGPAAFSTAFFFNQVHFAEIKGWHHLELVALFPFFSLVAVGAMIVFGGALDRLGTGRLMPWYQVPMIAAFIFFSQASTPAGAFLGLFMMGVSAGANATLVPAFWAEYYGTRNIGSIKAAAAAIMVLGSAIGPGVTGVFIDLGVSLDTQYLGVAVYFAIASALVYVGISRAMPLLPARGVTPV
jgi:MFS family permease